MSITVYTKAKIDALIAAAQARANHTGTQRSATISDLTETVQDIVAAMFAGQGTYNDAAGTFAINGVTPIADTTAPTIASFTATPGSTQAALSWAASDNVGVTSYTITRGGAQVYTGTATTFTDTGLTAGTTYTWTLTAKDAAGNTQGTTVTTTTTGGSTGGGTGGSTGGTTTVTPFPNPSTFYWQLQGTVDLDQNYNVYDIDGFTASAADFAHLNGRGVYPVAYFSAGSYENFRPDEASFPASVRGNTNGWAGENWLDIRQISVLQPIMEARADLARSKGAKAIEWDNVDGYLNNTGFPLTKADQMAYNKMLAKVAHDRGLAAIQKNDGDDTAALLPFFDACLAEQAYQYNEVDAYMAYPQAGKPLWVIEYKAGLTLNCADAHSRGIFLAKYPLDLDGPPSTVCAL